MVDGFRADDRGRRDVIEQMRGLASQSSDEWVAQLFASPTEPSALVLGALGGRFKRAIDRFNELPERLRWNYFVDRLRIAHRAARPDRAYVRLIKVDAHAPVRLASGTVFVANEERRLALKEGEDPPAARRYRLRRGATVTGMRVGSVRSYRRVEDGRDAVLPQQIVDGELRETCFPFGLESDTAHHGVTRTFYIASRMLRAGRRGTRVRILFRAVQPSVSDFQDGLSMLEWYATTRDGYARLRRMDVREHEGDVEVCFHLEADIEPATAEPELPQPGEAEDLRSGRIPALRLSKPASSESSSARDLGMVTFMSFSELELSFEGEDVPMTDALSNGHPIDMGAPFAPFGEPATTGSTLHVACGAVFGLPLATLSLCFEAAAGDLRRHAVLAPIPDDPGVRPVVAWRRWRAERWQHPAAISWLRPLPDRGVAGGDLSHFGGQLKILVRETGQPFSQESRVGDLEGHWIRIRLEKGDFGWARYLRAQEFLSRRLVEQKRSWSRRLLEWLGLGGAAAPVMPVRPTHPVLSAMSVSYCSEPVRSRSFTMWQAVADTTPKKTRTHEGERVLPFDYGKHDWGGELYVGFENVPGGDRESVGVYLDVVTVSTHDRRSNGEIAFDYWSSKKRRWGKLEVNDGTLGLTQAGILRWRAPSDWCPPDGLEPFTLGDQTPLRWVRVRVQAPSSDLCLTRVTCDAAEIEYEPTGPNDRSPELALVSSSPLIPERAIAGLTGMELLEDSRDGCGPEFDRQHLERAGRVTRHRGRAVSPRDVELLVLDTFPFLRLVRCIRGGGGVGGNRLDPGFSRVLLVTDAPGRLPTVDKSVLEEVSAFLARRSPHGVRWSVEDPRFVPVRIKVRVAIRSGAQPEDVREQVQSALTNRLVPLARVRGGSSEFGEPIGLSDIGACVRSQDGVERIAGLRFLGAFSGRSVARAPIDAILTSDPDHDVEIET